MTRVGTVMGEGSKVPSRGSGKGVDGARGGGEGEVGRGAGLQDCRVGDASSSREMGGGACSGAVMGSLRGLVASGWSQQDDHREDGVDDGLGQAGSRDHYPGQELHLLHGAGDSLPVGSQWLCVELY